MYFFLCKSDTQILTVISQYCDFYLKIPTFHPQYCNFHDFFHFILSIVTFISKFRPSEVLTQTQNSTIFVIYKLKMTENC